FCICCLKAAATTMLYTLSLHDALPIYRAARIRYCTSARSWRSVGRSEFAPPLPSRSNVVGQATAWPSVFFGGFTDGVLIGSPRRDRKSTRLNSSHVKISYAVFCLKKKK